MSQQFDPVRRLVRGIWRPVRRLVALLLGVGWAGRALIQVRRSLKQDGVHGRAAPPRHHLPRAAGVGIMLGLRVGRATCLERSTVLQAWYGAQGQLVDVVIGVAQAATGVTAHAWLERDGMPSLEGAGYEEIHRIAPATGGQPPRARR